MTGLVWFGLVFFALLRGIGCLCRMRLMGVSLLGREKRESGGAHTRGTLYPSLFVRDVYLPPHPNPRLLHPYEPQCLSF